jgi:hypothetical protein
VSTLGLPMPADLKCWLEYYHLPSLPGVGRAAVRVTPRDSRERKCPAYMADHYEVQAFYTTGRLDALAALEEALRAVPGVYATTQVRVAGPGASLASTFTNPGWPPALGTARRDRDSLRPMVIALIRDESEVRDGS